MLISTYCVNRITRVWTSGIEWKRRGTAPAASRFRAETPTAQLNSVHSRTRLRGGELQREIQGRGPSVDEYHVESTSNENSVEGVNHGAHRKEDHALPVVRYAGRRGGEILRFRLQEFEGRQDQPLWKRGIRGSRQEGGNGDDRGVRARRAEIPGAQRRSAFQLQPSARSPGPRRNPPATPPPLPPTATT